MANKKKVLYIVDDTKTAQFRYRVKNVMEALGGSALWELKWVLKSDLLDTDLDGFDLVVILRQTEKDGKVLNFIKRAHEKGLKVLFDLDDLIFDLNDLPILMKGTNSKNVLYWAGYVLGIRRIAKKVDGFITTNDFLAEKLKRSFKKPTAVIFNSLNREQVDESSKLIKEKKEDKKFLIGYFSGSPTHKRDFELVEPELIRFLKAHNDAVLQIVGYMEYSDKIKKLAAKKKVQIKEVVDYMDLEEMISKVDVNIAPLVVNDFTNCKSELKFFEAAVVETTTIASPTYAFKKAISNGKNGFLVGPGEWYDKLEYLYNNPEESKKIAKNARKYVLENYYGEKFLKEVEEVYEFFG